MKRPSRAVAFAVAAALAWAGVTTRAAEAEAERGYALRAMFLYNVMKFVTWPEAALGPAGAPIVVTIVGRDVADAARTTLAGKQLMGRRIVVTDYDPGNSSAPAHVVFVSADAGRQWRDVLRAASGHAVLTVAETGETSVPPPVITLKVVATKLAFSVNLDVADAQSLQLSSSLLDLAQNVRTTRLTRAGR